jgi:hypothetical protein
MGYIGNSYSQQLAQPATQFFSGNGSTTAFTLSQTPQSVYTVEVVVNNVQQNPQTSYYITGNILNFYSAPPSGSSNIYVNYNPVVTSAGQPGYGTVGTNQLGILTNINSGASNFTLRTGNNNTTAVNIDQNQNVSIAPAAQSTFKLQVANTYSGSSFLTDANVYALGIQNNGAVLTNDAVAMAFGHGGYNFTNFIASVRTSTNANPKGDLVFGGRPSDAASFTENMRLSADGTVRMQYQTFFWANALSAGTSLTSNAIPIYTSIVQSQGTNGYNTSTGIFTAQAAGVYTFTWCYLIYQANMVSSVSLIDDGWQYNGSFWFGGNRFNSNYASYGDGYVAVKGSATVKMATNDTFNVYTQTNRSGWVFYTGGNWGYFMGVKVA